MAASLSEGELCAQLKELTFGDETPDESFDEGDSCESEDPFGFMVNDHWIENEPEELIEIYLTTTDPIQHVVGYTFVTMNLTNNAAVSKALSGMNSSAIGEVERFEIIPMHSHTNGRQLFTINVWVSKWADNGLRQHLTDGNKARINVSPTSFWNISGFF